MTSQCFKRGKALGSTLVPSFYMKFDNICVCVTTTLDKPSPFLDQKILTTIQNIRLWRVKFKTRSIADLGDSVDWKMLISMVSSCLLNDEKKMGSQSFSHFV